jgi:iron complex outermembrane receptor protein
MQAAVKQQPKLRLSLIALACHVACLSASAAYAQTAASDTATAEAPEQKTVVVREKKLGMGLMVTEDAPKARSTITAEELEKQRPTGNAYEALEMMPAVNSYNYDATGLFGGGLTMRGFNSDQIGATINGVPVNDSGSYSVYPQEYVDQENTCSEFVTQGSTDVDSPQVGATGGNFGILTCSPEDKQRVRVMQTYGQLNTTKSFLRYDSGRLSDGRSKFFLSASHAAADKWKGEGRARRDHIDAAFDYDIDRFNYIHGTLLYNKALNNNVYNMSLAELNQYGYNYDFGTTVPKQPTPVNGTAQTTTVTTPAYYGLALNPFTNVIASATAKFRLTENTDLKILPYYWYGYGNGGTQQKVLTESSAFLNPSTGKVTAASDINGDGDTLDKVLVANASVTHTDRPGITTSITHTIGDHQILGGFWYERATHRQTGEAVLVNADGSPSSSYLDGDVVTRADGSPYESRNWKTISTAYQAFLQDTISLMDDKMTVNVGIRTPHVKRDFTNYANEGSPVSYNIKRSYNDVLPQLGVRYRVTNDDQLFASVAKNMKAPPNTAFATTSNVQIVNGVAVMSNVKEETSYNTDIGYRHQGKQLIGSFTVYNVDFRDRQATAYDPNTLVSVLTNVGKVNTRGFEIELGNTPISGWSFYGSMGYAKSEIKSDLAVSSTVNLPTAGKEMPLTPKLKAGLSAEYADGGFFARVKAKATGKQQATLTNDEEVPGYTVYGFDSGYTFANMGWLKRPKISLNVSNLTDKQYRNPSSQSVTNALAYSGYAAKTVYYYLGAPRYTSITFSGDF